MQQLSLPASIFCMAAPSDADLLAKWERHLNLLVQARHITLWSGRHLMAGTPRMQQIYDRLDHSDLIVLLLSSDFFDNDECFALMERAIKRAERGEAHLIPLLLHPVAWRESPLAPYPCMPSNNRPVTEWSNRDAAFEACVRDIRCLLGRPVTAPLTHHHTRTEPSQNQNRMRILRRVRAIWIEGLLMQSLHDAVRIELHLQDRTDVLENPLRLQVQELDQAPKALPDGMTIVHVYDEADEELLILGEPGAGKTTLLLELTRTLLERAEQDEQLCMPVIFNLSSWTEKREPLRAWLIEELWRIYQVPRKIGTAWIDSDQVLPLLDGLDEVAKDARVACVKQINAYYQARLERGSSSIVVCCRSEEYAALSPRIILQHAVSILPLTTKQISAYLEQAGEQVKGLRKALDDDAVLHNLARQPLMLNIFTLAYQGAQASDVPAGETREGMRHTIFARYVERMLKRREQSKRWKPKQVIHWLTFLAKQMRWRDQTVFPVENLQATWLSRRWRIRYQWCVALITGLYGVLFFGLFWGLFGLFLGLLLGSAGGLAFGLVLGPLMGLLFGLGGGLVFGPLIGLVVGLSTETPIRIEPTEALTWSWKEVLSSLVFWLIAGPVFGLVIGLPTIGPAKGLVYGLLVGLLAGLVIGLVVGLFFGLIEGLLQRRQYSERLSPNEGIWRSGKIGLFAGLVSGLVFGLVSGLVAGLVYGLLIGLLAGLVMGLVVGLLIGLLAGLFAFLDHFILRLFLLWQGDLPWKLIPFLDEVAERLLLRKVGGSYIFVHRQLLDYFASLDEPRLCSIE